MGGKQPQHPKKEVTGSLGFGNSRALATRRQHPNWDRQHYRLPTFTLATSSKLPGYLQSCTLRSISTQNYYLNAHFLLTMLPDPIHRERAICLCI